MTRFQPEVSFYMSKLIREIPLSNGLTVRFFDASRRYFGDYHQVRVKISCDVPLTPDLFQDEASYETATKLLGACVSYQKEIEHQGVAGASVEETVDRVIAHFVEHSLDYFSGPGFPKKLAQAELVKAQGRKRGFIPRGVHD